ncbi:hypothetical protein V1268_001033 [Enterococcus hirae]|nr:hypothetical protein [Enterococcus hirae]EMF0260757.1 hypothetical protein [Enterococcus hirae]EMF0394147.1 hypothetical protein [Enterococcus hirae]MCK6145719.1 hypothetical protein [Enterococcus hirae]MCK6173435.1 hypothetical protein [Enterococcus hirae]MDU1932980.1 hypothetical protein [Enterococcus hirae]
MRYLALCSNQTDQPAKIPITTTFEQHETTMTNNNGFNASQNPLDGQ